MKEKILLKKSFLQEKERIVFMCFLFYFIFVYVKLSEHFFPCVYFFTHGRIFIFFLISKKISGEQQKNAIFLNKKIRIKKE